MGPILPTAALNSTPTLQNYNSQNACTLWCTLPALAAFCCWNVQTEQSRQGEAPLPCPLAPFPLPSTFPPHVTLLIWLYLLVLKQNMELIQRKEESTGSQSPQEWLDFTDSLKRIKSAQKEGSLHERRRRTINLASERRGEAQTNNKQASLIHTKVPFTGKKSFYLSNFCLIRGKNGLEPATGENLSPILDTNSQIILRRKK